MRQTSSGAVVLTFPCGRNADKGVRETLGDLFEKALDKRFNGDLVAAAEAYSEARIEQIAEQMQTTDIDNIEYLDSDDYLYAMIGVMTEWLEEAASEQSPVRVKQNS